MDPHAMYSPPRRSSIGAVFEPELAGQHRQHWEPRPLIPSRTPGPHRGDARSLVLMARGTRAAAVLAAAGAAGLSYYLVVTGKLTADTGWGRRVRPLGPFSVEVAAPAGTVFDVIAGPYLGRTPRAMAGKLRV